MGEESANGGWFGRLRNARGAVHATRDMLRIVEEARASARSSDSDESAADMLRAKVSGHTEEAITAAIEHLRILKKEFVEDRAYRLLSAVREGRAVSPVDSESRALLDDQEQLGRMSLIGGFKRLIELEPALEQVSRDDAAASATATSATKITRRQSDLRPLVGPEARGSDPLLKSELAYSVALEYLAAREAGTLDERPYFERPRRVFHSQLRWESDGHDPD